MKSKASSFDELPDVLTVSEVASVLRLSRNAVYAGLRQGTIPSVRFGRRIMILKSELRAMLGMKAPAVTVPAARVPAAMVNEAKPQLVAVLPDGEYVVHVTYKGTRAEAAGPPT